MDFPEGLEDYDGRDGEDEFNNEQDDEFDEDGIKYGINFTTTVKKQNSEMIVTCTADENIVIQSVKVLSANDKDHEDKYKGPPFEDLSEGMRDALTSFLEDRKVNADLSSFILLYAQYKEQKEYVHWLKKLAEFTTQ